MPIFYVPIPKYELEELLGVVKADTLIRHHSGANLNIGWNGFGKSLESIVHTLGKVATRKVYLAYRGRFIQLPYWEPPVRCCKTVQCNR